MDVFGTVVSTIELVSKLVGYLQAVKGAKEDRQKLLSEVSALGALLDVLCGRLSPSADGNSDSISDKLVKAGIDRPLRMCLGALGFISRNLESLIPDVNVGTSLPTKISEKIKDLKWPFHKTDIKETLSSIERLKTLILLALQTSLVEFVEKAHEELVTMGLDVKEIKSAVSCLEANQRAHMKEIERDLEDLDTKLQHAVSKMENAVMDRMTAVQDIVVDNTAEVQKMAAKIDRNQQGQERQDIIKWLSAPNFDQKRANAFEKRAAGTGEWLLEHSKFKAWQRGEFNVLWCPGNPGVGKSVMTSVIIDHLQGGIADSDDTAVVFIYFDYTVEYKLQQLVEALLFQFVWRGMSVSNMESLQKHMRSNRPALDKLWDIFGTEVETYAQVFVVIDALDEAAGTWIPLLKHLRKFPNIRILATSRDLGNIATEFREDRRLDVISDEGDLKEYVEGYISDSTGSLERMVKRNPSLRARIITRVVEKAGGMFLLARLHMSALEAESSVVGLHRALGELPEDLESTYGATIGRISKKDKPLALCIFSWVIRAARPLRIDDLQYALAVEFDNSKDGMKFINTDFLHDPNHLMSVCVGLVIRQREQFYSDEKAYVGLAHYTTQDYLRKYISDTQLPHPAHLAITCLKYLAFDTFNGPLDWDSRQKLMDIPLAKYAINHWGGHVREHYDDSTVRQLATGLLYDHQKIAALGFLTFHIRDVSAIQLCARFGLEDYLIRLLDDGSNVNSKDSGGNTALIVAADRGHEGIVQLLLKQEGVDANAKDLYGNTALIAAAGRGHEGIVQLLLKQGIDPNAEGSGGTALVVAANHGCEGIVQLLLRQGVDVNAKSVPNGNMALIVAADRGHEGILQLLLKQEGVDVNAKGSGGNTALIAAADCGHEGILQHLLKQEGVDLNARDSDGNTALIVAANHGREEIVQLLLKQGADVNAKGSKSATPLIRAVMTRHQGIVELLLTRDGVNINSQDEEGYTPLAWAICRGDEAIAQVLLARDDLDASLTDNNRNTYLTLAAQYNGNGRIVKLLLDKGGINVNSRNAKGEVALAVAALQDHDEVVRVLLAQDDIDINAVDLRGRTPLDQTRRMPPGQREHELPRNRFKRFFGAAEVRSNGFKLLQAACAQRGVRLKIGLEVTVIIPFSTKCFLYYDLDN